MGRGSSDSSVSRAGSPPRYASESRPKVYQCHQGTKVACRTVETRLVCGRPAAMGGGEEVWVCHSAVCESDRFNYLVAAARLCRFPHISFFLCFSLLQRPGFVLLIIWTWPTFQILKFRKVRFTMTCSKCQLCDEPEPNSVFIAYLDVRSDKSDTNWLLLDYEACILFYFPHHTQRAATTC